MSRFDFTPPYPGNSQYVIVDPLETEGLVRRYDFADNPCQMGTDEECAEWLQDRLTELYND